MNPRAQVLITAAELISRIDAGDPLSILDVRWRLDEPDGRPAYLDGHIPGAVYVSLEEELSDHSVEGRGRHPLPPGTDLQEAGRRWGINQGDLVVVYDDWNRAGSGRAWWVLTAAGLDSVRILDGGLAAWRSAGGVLERGPIEPQPGDFTVTQRDLYAGNRPTVTAEQVNAGSVALLDARAPERFRGEVEPVDPVAGHIPGAKNLPSGAVLAANGTFLDGDAVARLLAERGIDGSVGAYCGSGVTASVVVAALAAAGHQAALFPGSWSEWISDPGRPVSRGPE